MSISRVLSGKETNEKKITWKTIDDYSGGWLNIFSHEGHIKASVQDKGTDVSRMSVKRVWKQDENHLKASVAKR